MSPDNVVASVKGLGSIFGAVGGILATLTVGYIAQKFGYAIVFFIGTFAYLLALGVLHISNPDLKQVTINQNN